MRTLLTLPGLLTWLAAAALAPAVAQTATPAASAASSATAGYPNRPIKLVVPIPPGGAPDIAGRVLAEKLALALGQPVVVENRAGSNGNIASELVARAPADGYTLLASADSMIAINPHLYARMPVDTLRELVPVSGLATNEWVLAVNPSLPVRTLREFIELAKKSSPVLAYASGGNGSQHQIAMEMLKQRAGINLLHVPYKGGSPATTAAVAGEVAAVFSGTSSAGQIRAGKLRALASTGRKRSEQFPELPTIGELYPGYELVIWLAIYAPAGTPEAILNRLNAEANKALALPDLKARFAAAGGLDPYLTSREDLAAHMRAEYEKFGKLIRAVGIKAD
jgi:tripartite-type tricarboxylate transporter receptor subunit TctC